MLGLPGVAGVPVTAFSSVVAYSGMKFCIREFKFSLKIPTCSSLSGLSSCPSFLSAEAIMRAVQFLEGVAELGIVHAFLAA